MRSQENETFLPFKLTQEKRKLIPLLFNKKYSILSRTKRNPQKASKWVRGVLNNSDGKILSEINENHPPQSKNNHKTTSILGSLSHREEIPSNQSILEPIKREELIGKQLKDCSDQEEMMAHFLGKFPKLRPIFHPEKKRLVPRSSLKKFRELGKHREIKANENDPPIPFSLFCTEPETKKQEPTCQTAEPNKEKTKENSPSNFKKAEKCQTPKKHYYRLDSRLPELISKVKVVVFSNFLLISDSSGFLLF